MCYYCKCSEPRSTPYLPSEATEHEVSPPRYGSGRDYALGRSSGQFAAIATFPTCHSNLQPLDLVCS